MAIKGIERLGPPHRRTDEAASAYGVGDEAVRRRQVRIKEPLICRLR
jgi:hypothetical protein